MLASQAAATCFGEKRILAVLARTRGGLPLPAEAGIDEARAAPRLQAEANYRIPYDRLREVARTATSQATWNAAA